MPSRDRSGSPRRRDRDSRRYSRSPRRDRSGSRERDRERDRDRDKERHRRRDEDRRDRGRDDGGRGRRDDRRDREEYGSRKRRNEDSRSPERKRGRDDQEDRPRRRSASPPYRRQRDVDGDRNGRGQDGKPADDNKPAANGDGNAAGGETAGEQAPAAEIQRKPVNTGKTGGVYIPPFKLARMMQEVSDRGSAEYQKLTWEALKKSINGIVNKVNATNIKAMLPEVFRENLVRGRGLLCRSLMKSQMASPPFTPVYAALLAVVNTKFPEIGELLLSRLVLQFKRSYARNDKPVCTAAAKFLAHLVNQGVAHEVLALECLILMLENPSADGVEMAVEFVKEVGAHLQDVAPQGLHSVFERFRAILHEGKIDMRVQFIIEGLFAIRKAGFEASGYKAVKPELDLVEEEDQITHELSLEDSLQANVALDVFKVDLEYEQHEAEYAAIQRELFGESDAEDADDEGEEGSDGDESDTDDSDAEDHAAAAQAAAQQQRISDQTQTNLVNLRRTIYLTLMSSLDFEEAGHKLLKIKIDPGQEVEVVTMILECCSQERTYKRFFGLLAQRFCYLNRTYQELFADCFTKQYVIIHRLEINKLRNVACLFAHLLATDALPWSVLACIRLTEEDTTSSSRIYIKYLFQELSSTLGLLKLNERLNDPAVPPEWFDGIFPKDSAATIRFSVNFFTSIGLGGLTDKLREYYAKLPKTVQQAPPPVPHDTSSSGSDTSSSSSSSSDSDSDSDSDSSSSSSSSSGSSSSSDSSSSDSDSDDDSRGGRRGKHKKR